MFHPAAAAAQHGNEAGEAEAAKQLQAALLAKTAAMAAAMDHGARRPVAAASTTMAAQLEAEDDAKMIAKMRAAEHAENEDSFAAALGDGGGGGAAGGGGGEDVRWASVDAATADAATAAEFVTAAKGGKLDALVSPNVARQQDAAVAASTLEHTKALIETVSVAPAAAVPAGYAVCSQCSAPKPKAAFSSAQLKKKDSRRCKECVAPPALKAAAAPAPAPPAEAAVAAPAQSDLDYTGGGQSASDLLAEMSPGAPTPAPAPLAAAESVRPEDGAVVDLTPSADVAKPAAAKADPAWEAELAAISTAPTLAPRSAQTESERRQAKDESRKQMWGPEDDANDEPEVEFNIRRKGSVTKKGKRVVQKMAYVANNSGPGPGPSEVRVSPSVSDRPTSAMSSMTNPTMSSQPAGATAGSFQTYDFVPSTGLAPGQSKPSGNPGGVPRARAQMSMGSSWAPRAEEDTPEADTSPTKVMSKTGMRPAVAYQPVASTDTVPSEALAFWGSQEVTTWARVRLDRNPNLRFTRYSQLFETGNFDGGSLPKVDASKLEEMGIAAIEHRDTIMRELALLLHNDSGGVSVSGVNSTWNNGALFLTFGGDREEKQGPIGDPIDGAQRGADALGQGIVDGLAGLVSEPMREYEEAEARGADGGALAIAAIKGMGQGIVGLVDKPVSGAMDFTSKVSEGLRNTSALVDDTEAPESLYQQVEQPSNLGSGLASGIGAFSSGVVDGIVDLFSEPIRGAQTGGAEGFALGLAKGLTSVITKPIAGTLDLAVKTTQGALNTPRAIAEGIEALAADEEEYKANQVDPLAATRIFGAKLTVVCARAESDVRGVPRVVEQLLSELEQRAMGQIGLFQIAGPEAAVASLLDAFNRGGDIPQLEHVDPNTIATLLCQFLLQLPEPLTTSLLYDEFAALARELNGMQLTRAIQRTCRSIKLLSVPEPRALFLRLLLFFFKLSLRSEINQMTSRTISRVFGPLLFRAPKSSVFSSVTDHTPVVCALLRFMIDNAIEITEGAF